MKKPKYTSLFSYYGSKSKIAYKYPEPKTRTIIEPFGGSGAYSLLYPDHNIWINDNNERVYKIWKFLQSETALQKIEKLPARLTKGMNILDIAELNEPDNEGLLYFVSAEINRGSCGTPGFHKIVTNLGEQSWPRVKKKMRILIPKIRKFTITNMDYTKLPNIKATWFIDPPYSNVTGRRYKNNVINYKELADWIYNRSGTVIVCELYTAEWMPFVPLVKSQGVTGRYQKSVQIEGIYYREDICNNTSKNG